METYVHTSDGTEIVGSLDPVVFSVLRALEGLQRKSREFDLQASCIPYLCAEHGIHVGTRAIQSIVSWQRRSSEEDNTVECADAFPFTAALGALAHLHAQRAAAGEKPTVEIKTPTAVGSRHGRPPGLAHLISNIDQEQSGTREFAVRQLYVVRSQVPFGPDIGYRMLSSLARGHLSLDDTMFLIACLPGSQEWVRRHFPPIYTDAPGYPHDGACAAVLLAEKLQDRSAKAYIKKSMREPGSDPARAVAHAEAIVGRRHGPFSDFVHDVEELLIGHFVAVSQEPLTDSPVGPAPG